MTTHTHRLDGCRPEPLASYLKALGILRLVSEQVDPHAAGWWKDDVFHLRTRLNREELIHFFVHEYSPTPIASPWNGGSGFYPKDNKSSIEYIKKCQHPRFKKYSDTILACEAIINSREESPKDEEKLLLINQLRNTLSDEALEWLDAAWVLGDAAKAAPILGTGGNDGRLDFSNNFMQRLIDCLPVSDSVDPTHQRRMISSSLYFDAQSDFQHLKIGQFSPPDAGGPNGSTGLSSKGASPLNPWDFILNFEGAIMLIGAMSRKLGSTGNGLLTFPFTVRPSSVAYSTEFEGDGSSTRAEIWMPLWGRPTKREEVSQMFSEARAEKDGRPASNGLDFAKAVKSIGVSRGISTFSRTSFMVRNGLAFLAVPLGRVEVGYSPEIRIINELDRWIDRARSSMRGDKTPASLRRAYNRLESSIFKVCSDTTPNNFAELLIALGKVEHQLVLSKDLRTSIPPVNGLSLRWLKLADDGTVEFRLARSLASMRLRPWLEPIEIAKEQSLPTSRTPWKFDENPDVRVVWAERSFERNLHALFTRLLLDIQRENPPRDILAGTTHFASPEDLQAFIDRKTDDTRLSELFLGLSLLRWPGRKEDDYQPTAGRYHPLPAVYSILKLTHLPCHPLRSTGLAPLPIPPNVYRLATGGQNSAIALATRRLRSSGLQPRASKFQVTPDQLRRSAAALLFPIHPQTIDKLVESIVIPSKEPGDYSSNLDDTPSKTATTGS